MTTVYSTNYDKAYVTANGIVPAGEYSGNVKIMYDTYAWTAAMTLADKVYLQKLPAGARVIEAVLRSTTTSGAGKWDLGHEASTDKAGTAIVEDDDAFIAALDPTGGTATTYMTAAAGAAGFCRQFGEETQIYVKVDTATTTATSGTLTVVVYYVVD